LLFLALGCATARRAAPDSAEAGGLESASAREIRLREEVARSGAATALEDGATCRAQAQRLLAAGEPDAARTLLERATVLNPDDWESHRELAGILRERAAAPAAVLVRDSLLEELDCLVALRPTEEDWRLQRDRWRLAAGGAAEREQALRRNLAANPTAVT
jgi:hypothetical protein